MTTKFSRNKTPQPTPVVCKTTSPCIMPEAPGIIINCTIQYQNIFLDPVLWYSAYIPLRFDEAEQKWIGEAHFFDLSLFHVEFWYDELEKTFDVYLYFANPEWMVATGVNDNAILAFVNPVMMSDVRYAVDDISGTFRYYISQ